MSPELKQLKIDRMNKLIDLSKANNRLATAIAIENRLKRFMEVY